MRAVIQRVHRAQVSADGAITGNVGQGLFVLLGVGQDDGPEDAEWLVQKIVQLRIFNDADGLMNNSVENVQGGVLIVSQFTLHARYKKGNRPSFIAGARPEVAENYYLQFCELMRKRLGQSRVGTGKFGAHMDIEAELNGPVTIIMDTKNKE